MRRCFLRCAALLDSGIPLVAAIVFVILGTGYGIWMARRMARYWPGARDLTGAERVTVVRAARRGELVGDARLARSVIDYSRGLHAAAEESRPYRRLVWFMLAVAAVLALWDAVYGSTRDAVASCVYVALLAIERFWWPKRQAQLLSNADRAAETARYFPLSRTSSYGAENE